MGRYVGYFIAVDIYDTDIRNALVTMNDELGIITGYEVLICIKHILNI